MRAFSLIALLALAACSNSTALNDMLDRLEFECGETGNVILSTQLDLNGNPLVNSNTSVMYEKHREDANAGCEDGQE